MRANTNKLTDKAVEALKPKANAKGKLMPVKKTDGDGMYLLALDVD